MKELEKFIYSKLIIKKLNEYNSTKKGISNCRGNDCDKYQNKISVSVGISMYRGYYGSSSIYTDLTVPVNMQDIVNKAVNSYLNKDIDQVLIYISNFILKEAKKDIDSIRKQSDILLLALQEIEES